MLLRCFVFEPRWSLYFSFLLACKCISEAVQVIDKAWHSGYKTIMRRTERERRALFSVCLVTVCVHAWICACVCLCVCVWCNYSQVLGVEPSRSIVSLSVACGGADLPTLLSSPQAWWLSLALVPLRTSLYRNTRTQVRTGKPAACFLVTCIVTCGMYQSLIMFVCVLIIFYDH